MIPPKDILENEIERLTKGLHGCMMANLLDPYWMPRTWEFRQIHLIKAYLEAHND